MHLHITNGSILKTYLETKGISGQKVIAFNESMITGECTETIFSEEFFQLRAKTLQVPYERYDELTVKELDELVSHSYEEIILWFDDDMFCQMNILTLCAYLDASNYQGEVHLHIIRQDFWQYDSLQDIILISYQINPAGYYEIYREVLLQRRPAREKYPVFAELNAGINLYTNYISANSDIRLAITKMVKENKDKPFVIKEINEKYPHYGIGDYNIQLIYRDIVDTIQLNMD